nr:M48 family metalloprotease [Simiduia aestuariiviva]
MGISLPLTLYQAQASGNGLNAMLSFFPNELVIVLQGDWAKHHSEQELLAVFGHEIAHHKLYTEQDGQFFTTMRILSWCQQQPDCSAPYVESYRRYQLFTEVYADLGSQVVTGEWQSSVANLIKVTTGVSEVSVDDYVAQADEVLAKHKIGSQQTSHPEIFLRAKILHSLHQAQHKNSWNAKAWQTETQQLVIGPLDVVSLDLLDQQLLTEASLQLINLYTANTCFQTDTIEALAQEFFPEFTWPTPALKQALDTVEASNSEPSYRDTLTKVLDHCSDNTREYLSFVLLDFACADPDCQPDSYSHALRLAQQLGFENNFEPLFRKELKMKKEEVAKLLANSISTAEEADDHE